MVKAQLQKKYAYSRNVKFLELDHFLFKGAAIMKLPSVNFTLIHVSYGMQNLHLNKISSPSIIIPTTVRPICGKLTEQ